MSLSSAPPVSWQFSYQHIPGLTNPSPAWDRRRVIREEIIIE